MDWYRRTTWTKNDEKEFFEKLNRARKYNHHQYLKVQAIELIDTLDDNFLDTAEFLLKKALKDYPDERIGTSQCYNSLGTIYERKGDVSKALKYYKKSLAFEESFPNVITNTYLDYSELVVKNKLVEEYNNVIQLLIPKVELSIFPLAKYIMASCLAAIFESQEKIEEALKYKEIAEINAAKETTELRYHKKLRVVKKRTSWLDKLLKNI